MIDEIFADMQDKNEIKDSIEILRLRGGGAGGQFLVELYKQKPNLKVGALRGFCEAKNKNEIAGILKKYNDEDEICRVILEDDLTKFKVKLNKDDFWEIIAESKIGFDNGEINREELYSIIQRIHLTDSGNVQSCTESFLEVLNQKKPNLTIHQLAEHCRTIGMNDAAKKLGKFASI